MQLILFVAKSDISIFTLHALDCGLSYSFFHLISKKEIELVTGVVDSLSSVSEQRQC